MYLKDFFKKYIEGTQEKAIVADLKMFLCHLTNAVMKGMNIDDYSIKNIYITSRCVKHLFDKKTKILLIRRSKYSKINDCKISKNNIIKTKNNPISFTV